ncbi:hypothetical protein F9K33_16245 [bacterium]|nr:MAG: hypothetical protein F9K33_16245 [bacterium]
MKYCTLFFLLVFVTSCAAPPRNITYSDEYDKRPTLQSSLFKSDQSVLDDSTIARILSSKVVLPMHAKIALMKFPDRYESNYYSYYWRSEDHMKLQQSYADTISSILLRSGRIDEVSTLPDLMVPKDANISVLREAAVRLQADLLLVYRISTDVYQEYAIWGKDKVKAFGNCEAVFIDVRTGIIPFTTVVTEDFLAIQEKSDLNLGMTVRRAKSEATIKALTTTSQQITDFLNKISK